MQQLAECVVAGHAELARAQDVCRRQVLQPPVRPLELLQTAGEVVQRDGAGMGDAEGVEEVGQRYLAQHLQGGPLATPLEVAFQQEPVIGGRAEGVVVRHERVHAVDGDELLGQRVGHAEVVASATPDDAADDLARR